MNTVFANTVQSDPVLQSVALVLAALAAGFFILFVLAAVRRKRTRVLNILIALAVGTAFSSCVAFEFSVSPADGPTWDRRFARVAVGRNGRIAKALNVCRWDMGKYPDTNEGLTALLQPKSHVDDERYNGPYLKTDYIEDPWGKPFVYRSPGQFHKDGFDLWSCGPDREDNGGKEGSDDIKNWVLP